MGNGDSKINYETVDRTDRTARAQGQRKAQEENEKRMEELRNEMEKSRQQALCEARERARIEDDEQRRHLDHQRRQREERERKQKEEERFCVLKDELMNYDFQKGPRIKKESFRDLMVNDIDVLRIALIGPTGSGKTSFVGYAPVTVITYLDKLKTKDDKDEAFDQASWATGSSSERTYFIANYIHDAKPSLEVDRAALDILDSALLSAERFIQIRKQREKNKMEREAMATGVSSSAETVEQLFGRLQRKYKWTDQGKVKAVLESLRQQEIKTTKVLKELWEDVKYELPLSIGMKIGLEEEMKRLQL